jgi:hypothetical protein
MYKFILQTLNDEGNVIAETFHKTMTDISKQSGLAYHVIFRLYKNEYDGKRIHKSIQRIINKYRVIDNPNLGLELETTTN